MNGNLAKLILGFFTVIWGSLANKWQKIGAIITVLFGITVYSIIVSWGSLRMEMATAYDERWHANYREAHKENDALKVEIATELRSIKTGQATLHQDLQELKNALIRNSR